MTPSNPPKGQFVLRYEELPDGQLLVDVDLPDFGHIGPIRLDKKLNTELGDLLAKGVDLLAQAGEQARLREDRGDATATEPARLAKVLRLVRTPPDRGQ